MGVTENPDNGLPTNAQKVTTEWAPDTGETRTEEWNGSPVDIKAKYLDQQDASGIRGMTKTIGGNRAATLVCRFERADSGQPESVTTIEELWAQDVIRPVEYAPYFTTAAATKLDDDDISWVMMCVDEQWEDAEINAAAVREGKTAFTAWTDSMKELRYHVLHGQDSYLETTFLFRRSLYGIRESQMQGVFGHINEVVDAPIFSTDMSKLVKTLPTGEWMYRCPQVTHLGRGRWSVQAEFIYADKISAIYGGTWGV